MKKILKLLKKYLLSILTLLSRLFELFALLIGALTFGNDREINAEVVAIKFVFRGACVTYKKIYIFCCFFLLVHTVKQINSKEEHACEYYCTSNEHLKSRTV